MSPGLLPFLFRRLTTPQKVVVVGSVLIVLGVIVAAIVAPPARERANVANPRTVWRICQERIAAELKAPASAEFPSYSDNAITHSGALWTVDSYVDSQNSFGAKLRTRYSCTASFNPNDATYDIEGISAS